MSSTIIRDQIARAAGHALEGRPGVEYRSTLAELRIESSDSGARQIVGHAAVFDQWTTLYSGRYWTWRECVRRGAFTNALREKQDVRALFNHDANFCLGRTRAGTLALIEDEVGLLSRCDFPDTQTIRDLVISPIERRDMTGMSFGFNLRRVGDVVQTETPDGVETYSDGAQRVTVRYEGDMMIEERELLNLDLFDVSPVVYPAYEGTDVALRSVPHIGDLIALKDVPHESRGNVAAPFSISSYLSWLTAIDAAR